MFICCGEQKKKKEKETFCLKLPLWHRLAQPLAGCSRECFNRIKPRSVHQRKNGIKRTLHFPGAFLSVWVYGVWGGCVLLGKLMACSYQQQQQQKQSTYAWFPVSVRPTLSITKNPHRQRRRRRRRNVRSRGA